jgi:hypothetical protein
MSVVSKPPELDPVVTAARAGDEGAFAEVVHEHHSEPGAG